MKHIGGSLPEEQAMFGDGLSEEWAATISPGGSSSTGGSPSRVSRLNSIRSNRCLQQKAARNAPTNSLGIAEHMWKLGGQTGWFWLLPARPPAGLFP